MSLSHPDLPTLASEKSPLIDQPSCQLLGPTALVVQALMGVLVILSLVYKRHRESPVRPWRIWLFDVSKQIVGQLFIHGLNVLVSDVTSRLTSGNACVFYFLNILVDTTLGVIILYVILYSVTYVLSEKLGLQGFESGVYGDPPSIAYWMRQATIYVLSLLSMKLLVIVLFSIFPAIFTFGEWLLSWTWTEEGDAFQVIFTMGIFPIIMNILQFWFIDSIVKAHNIVKLDSDVLHGDHGDHEPLFGVPSDDEDDDTYVPPDLENQRSRSRSLSLSFTTDASITKSEASEDQRLSRADLKQGSSDKHSYPPSLSNSIITASSSTSPKPAKSLLKLAQRRQRNVIAVAVTSQTTHTPSHSQAIHQPQPRTPQVAMAAADLELKIRHPSHVSDDWSNSWDDSGDWTDQATTKDDIDLSPWDSTATVRAHS